jgi:hypothetical protein
MQQGAAFDSRHSRVKQLWSAKIFDTQAARVLTLYSW